MWNGFGPRTRVFSGPLGLILGLLWASRFLYDPFRSSRLSRVFFDLHGSSQIPSGLFGSSWILFGSSRVFSGLLGSSQVFLGLLSSFSILSGLLGCFRGFLGPLGSSLTLSGLLRSSRVFWGPLGSSRMFSDLQGLLLSPLELSQVFSDPFISFQSWLLPYRCFFTCYSALQRNMLGQVFSLQ